MRICPGNPTADIQLMNTGCNLPANVVDGLACQICMFLIISVIAGLGYF